MGLFNITSRFLLLLLRIARERAVLLAVSLCCLIRRNAAHGACSLSVWSGILGRMWNIDCICSWSLSGHLLSKTGKYYDNKPPHDKTEKCPLRPAKPQIRPVWSASSLYAWRNIGSLATHYAHCEDSNQTGRIRVFAGRTDHFFFFQKLQNS